MRAAPKHYPRPGGGGAWSWGLILVVAGFVGGSGSAQGQQAGVPSLRPDASTTGAIATGPALPGRPETASLPPNPDVTSGTSALLQPLDISDVNRYHQIFELQRQGRFREAELLIGWLGDHRLMGHVLAQRYLHPGYSASYRELAALLAGYADQPESPRLYKLALKKRPAGPGLPHKPEVDLFRTGTPDGSVIAADPHWRAGLLAPGRGNLSPPSAAVRLAAPVQRGNQRDLSAAAHWAARTHL